MPARNSASVRRTPATVSRAPRTGLSCFVDRIWAARPDAQAQAQEQARELVLPTGSVHVVFRLSREPLRIYAGFDDAVGFPAGWAVVGGIRLQSYLRDVSRPSATVGALLKPGAAPFVLGVPADRIAHGHFGLAEFWGRSTVDALAERLCNEPDAERRIEILERAIARRVSGRPGIDPFAAWAISALETPCSIRQMTEASGYSHRHFAARFRAATGLTPNAYRRILRFNRAIDCIAAEPEIGLADLAMALGYADQSHFTREFREFGGVSPGRYRRISPASPRHVPVEATADGAMQR